jgi:hypothetical protein
MPEVSQAKAASPNSNPYGLAAISQTGHSSSMGAFGQINAEAENPAGPVSNRAAALAFMFAFVALALNLVTALPGSPTIWIGAASLIAVLWAVRAIVLRAQRRATNAWVPVVSIVFAVGAAAITLLGINVMGLMTTAVAQLATPTAPTAEAVAVAPQFSAEPFVFASNQSLTSDGTTVQQIATALNRAYAGGNSSLGAGQAWPAAVTLTDTQVMAPAGSLLATVTPGYAFTYRLAADLKSYSLAVTSGDGTEVAIYYSASDNFGFTCPSADAHCVPLS